MLCTLGLAGSIAAAGPGAGTARPLVRSDAAGPWSLAVDGGVSIGFFFTTHGKAGVSFGRRFWDRLEIEASFRAGGGVDLVALEQTLRVGVLLHFNPRWELLLAWRGGHSRFRTRLPAGVLWSSAGHMAVVVEIKYMLLRSLELRMAPLVAVGYWDRLWGFTLEPVVGLAWRF